MRQYGYVGELHILLTEEHIPIDDNDLTSVDITW